MSFFSTMKRYGRFGWGLRGFLRHTITLEQARAIVRQRMEEREANFLRLVERGIFGYSRSPYLPLMNLAGCEMGDIYAYPFSVELFCNRYCGTAPAEGIKYHTALIAACIYDSFE